MEQALENVGSTFTQILEDNKLKMLKIEEFRNQPIKTIKRNLGAAALISLAFFIAGLFALEVITGAIAVFVSVTLAVTLFFGVRFLHKMDPYIQQKTKNLLLKKMVEEAKENSIFQLDNQVILNTQRLTAGRAVRDKMGALVKNLENKVKTENKDKPWYAKKLELFKIVSGAYQKVIENLKRAEAANIAFEEKVTEYKDMDAFTSIVNQVMQMYSSLENNKLENILSLAAFENIDNEFNQALVMIENQTQDFPIQEEE